MLRNISPLSAHFSQLKNDHTRRKRNHCRLLRYNKMQEGFKRDNRINKLCSKTPNQAFKFLSNMHRSENNKINRLYVQDNLYTDEDIPYGMFRSIEILKTEEVNLCQEDPSYPDFSEEYRHIIDICAAGASIPLVSREKSLSILKSLRQNVNDFYSITSCHFLNAGEEGIEHFHRLFNSVLSNVNLAGLPELNTIYACVLFKGHGKDKEQARSYRTISTCPLLAKALDCYIRELSLDRWTQQQAPTQFQGRGMSHELASILLTESIQYSLNASNRPLYALFLDARSAFDRVIKEILIRNIYNSGIKDQTLIYLDKRLDSRRTFCDYDRQLMGPIIDSRGLEQGGITSSEEYKLYNNEQAITAQESSLGVVIENEVVSCISLADDALLMANTLYDLRNLLHLTVKYCEKYDVELVPDKIQLIAFHGSRHEDEVNLAKQTFELTLDGRSISFTENALHLGTSRHERQPSNMTSVLDRLSAHRRQMFAMMPAGMALRHSGNPSATLRVHQLYCMPVLLSGLAPLVLRKQEVNTINKYFKNTLRRLMKLGDHTPDSAIYFLAGTVPAVAHLHLRQLSLFYIVCNLDDNILKRLAYRSLICSKASEKSWFHQIRAICIQYRLPDPLHLLSFPPAKQDFKKLCKSNVHEFWHSELARTAEALPSLRYFRPRFLSLSCPHPLWSSLDSNPFQARAANIQALFLTGRYKTARLCRHWDSSNRDGYCPFDSCRSSDILEDIEHLLLHCPAHYETRRRLWRMTASFTAQLPLLAPIIHEYLYAQENDLTMQFLLDCSTLPLVIAARQLHGQNIYVALFKLTRTWCFSIHRSRQQLLVKS